MEALQTELKTCKVEKNDLNGKLKMVLTKLESAKSLTKHMNIGSITLDEILKNRKNDSSKAGPGYKQEAPTSKNTCNSIFVRCPTLHSMTPTSVNTAHVNTINKRNVPKPRFVPICHFYGIKRKTSDYTVTSQEIA